MKIPVFSFSHRFFFFLFLFAAAVTTTIFAFSPETAVAVGFGVSPSSFEFVVEKGSEASRQLTIYNTGEETEFTLTSSDSKLLQLLPAKGTIPKEGMAAVKVTAKGAEVGDYEEELTISISNSNGKSDGEVSLVLGTTAAVKLKVTAGDELAANAAVGVLLSAGIVASGLSAYYVSKRKVRERLGQIVGRS